MPIKFSNNASATIASSISNVATTIALSSGEGALFPSLAAGEFFYGTLVDTSQNLEIVKVTARSTDTLTVVRAQDGTTARSYAAGSVFELRLEAAAFAQFPQIDASYSNPTWITSLAGSKITGDIKITTLVVGGSSAPATSLDVQTTGANAIGSFFTTGISDLNFRLGAMNGVSGSTGTSQAKFGLFYVGTGECATIDFIRGGGATDGSIAFRTAGTQRAIIDNSGNFTATGNVTANSDERLKTNIQTISNALAKVESARGVTFNRKSDGSAGIGVIAQEIQKVAPEAVIVGDDGILSVAYGNLVGLLIEAVKELSLEVKTLKQKVGE